jgi:hypothetical protein
LRSRSMVLEFERYSLGQFRVITGVLQILGGIGMAAGLINPWFALVSSLGFSVQMFFALVVRIRIKDSVEQMAPALFFCMVNIFIFWRCCLELQLI